ncbi:predicted protein [Methanosarcina acetivorans C2A]|uniref:Uncharacterized protein n=1 Tax=Methanosarcina acetivorans (strain ATCC 35395 / DSM 2834 / JCM 12185 / C2A) TaxID=188937 RepID=Q8TIE1_METAC|nr:predicted protein [Methanosarcina acetivorans C2A]
MEFLLSWELDSPLNAPPIRKVTQVKVAQGLCKLNLLNIRLLNFYVHCFFERLLIRYGNFQDSVGIGCSSFFRAYRAAYCIAVHILNPFFGGSYIKTVFHNLERNILFFYSWKNHFYLQIFVCVVWICTNSW